MSDYDVALEQFINELGSNKKQFDLNIEEFGWDYVTYYRNRWHEVQSGY